MFSISTTIHEPLVQFFVSKWPYTEVPAGALLTPIHTYKSKSEMHWIPQIHRGTLLSCAVHVAYQVLILMIAWWTKTLHCRWAIAQHPQRVSWASMLIAQENIKIQNWKCSLYWMYITFTSPESCLTKNQSQTIANQGPSISCLNHTAVL